MLVLKEKFKSYENALLFLNLDNLQTRRKDMILRFAKNGIRNQTLNDLFPINEKTHKMNKRTNQKYAVNFANTDRLKMEVSPQCKSCSIKIMRKMLHDHPLILTGEPSVIANHDCLSSTDCIVFIAEVNLILSYLIIISLCPELYSGYTSVMLECWQKSDNMVSCTACASHHIV